MHDLLSHLNDKQREAVTAPLGPALVLAGAGSGKTRVLTYRIAWLLEERVFSPADLLALTFTNKAAGEMKGRIERILNTEDRIQNRNSEFSIRNSITMGTFHSVCARILRQEIENLRGRGRGGSGYSRNFVIYDESDSLAVMKQIVLELGLADNFRPQVFAYYISAAKNRLVSPGEFDLDNSYLEDSLQKVYELYQERLQAHNALDFDDLLVLVCKLFSSNKKTLKKYQDRFKYILVDEYQDTNHAQYVMLKLLVKDHRNIFVVGDDAQSIYRFRGANMQNILDFKKDYPKAKIFTLEQNYRSTQDILDVAGEVIKLNPFQYEKKLWTEKKEGQKVSLYEARDERDEAEFVLDVIANPERVKQSQIKEIASSPPKADPRNDEISYTPILDQFTNKFRRFHIPYSKFDIPDNLNEIVILYRTHAQSRVFEELLVQAGIPYQIVGGVKFYERQEIKDTLAYLRLAVNPKDLVSLARVINIPARGIGPVAFKEINKVLKKYKYDYHRLLSNIDELDLSPRALAGAREFFEMLDSPPHEGRDLPFDSPPHEEGLGEVIENKAGRKSKSTMTPSSSPSRGGGPSILDIMHFLLTRSGYKADLLKDVEGEQRWENLEELFNVAGKYKNLPWREGLVSFLEEIALMSDIDKAPDDNKNKLTLMTLHSAKGLEFSSVFFVGLEEGLLPHSRSLLHPEEIAEEIRLAYVGMTRAKQNLYLSYARQRQSYGEIKRCIPSRVIKAIPKRLLRKLST